ncbi:MAG: recombinase family protein [bacterium]
MQPQRPRKKLIRYSRVSSQKQTLDRQNELLNKWLAAHEDEYEEDVSLRMDDDGLSGSNKRRNNITFGELGRFIADLRDPKNTRIPEGSVLLIDAVDRISRQDIMTTMGIWADIIRHGVNILIVNPEVEVGEHNINDLNVVLPLIIGMATAYEESQKKAIRTKQNWSRKLDRYTPGQILTKVYPQYLNLTITKEEKTEFGTTVQFGTFAPKPTVKEVIKKAFDMASKGSTQQKILKELNANTEKYKPWTNKGRFTQTYLSKLLKDRALLGEVTIGTKTFANYYPKLVDKKLFDKVQVALKQKKRVLVGDNKRVNLFRGMVFNTNDGSPMVMHAGTATRKSGKKVEELWLRSLKVQDKATDACPIRINYKRFEHLILNSFIEFVKDIKTDDVQDEINDKTEMLKLLYEQMTDRKKSQRQVQRIRDQASILEAELELLEAAKEESTNPHNKKMIKTLYQMKDESYQDRYTLYRKLRAAVSRITVTLEKYNNGTTGCRGKLLQIGGGSTSIHCFKATAVEKYLPEVLRKKRCKEYGVYRRNGNPVAYFSLSSGYSLADVEVDGESGVVRDKTNNKSYHIEDVGEWARNHSHLYELAKLKAETEYLEKAGRRCQISGEKKRKLVENLVGKGILRPTKKA